MRPSNRIDMTFAVDWALKTNHQAPFNTIIIMCIWYRFVSGLRLIGISTSTYCKILFNECNDRIGDNLETMMPASVVVNSNTANKTVRVIVCVCAHNIPHVVPVGNLCTVANDGVEQYMNNYAVSICLSLFS